MFAFDFLHATLDAGGIMFINFWEQALLSKILPQKSYHSYDKRGTSLDM